MEGVYYSQRGMCHTLDDKDAYTSIRLTLVGYFVKGH